MSLGCSIHSLVILKRRKQPQFVEESAYNLHSFQGFIDDQAVVLVYEFN